MQDKEADIRVRLRAAEDFMKYYGTKIAIEREKLAMEEERLELEKRKVDSAEPDKEIKVIISGYQEEWSE